MPTDITAKNPILLLLTECNERLKGVIRHFCVEFLLLSFFLHKSNSAEQNMTTKFDQDCRFSAHRYLARQLRTYMFTHVWRVIEIETSIIYGEVLDETIYKLINMIF